jgi:putative FmdB family regulatory protein
MGGVPRGNIAHSRRPERIQTGEAPIGHRRSLRGDNKQREGCTCSTWASRSAGPDILALSYRECQQRESPKGALLPTYEYRCKSCERAFEAVQAFSDTPLTTCETCGGTLKKVYGAVGIVFKGSGFYKTDSRSSGSSAKRSDAASNGHEAKTKSDSPAAASEAKPISAPSPAPSKEMDTATTK